MAELSEEAIQEWFTEHAEVLRRAELEAHGLAERFVDDYTDVYDFRFELVEPPRTKTWDRTLRKARRRGLEDTDQLLQRCHDNGGRLIFPVHDLIGVRIQVVSLADVRAIRKAIESLQVEAENYPLGNLADAGIEDINQDPRPSGYRALHVDGAVKVKVGTTDYVVPFELQVMTLAQKVFDRHTHEDAYVPDQANQDSRYELVKGLQRALAEQMNAADLLLERIQEVAWEMREEINRNEAGPELSAASVTQVALKVLGLRVGNEAATRLSEAARSRGITATDDFEALIDPSGDAAAGFADSFQQREGRAPSNRELVEGQAFGFVDEAALRARIEAEEPPENALDQLDTEAVEPAAAEEGEANPEPGADGSSG